MKKGWLPPILLLLVTLMCAPFSTVAATEVSESSGGQDYVIQRGDGLYQLGRKFFGKGIAYKQIISANNAKAATDSRYALIDEGAGLMVGQLIWIPIGSNSVLTSNSNSNAKANVDTNPNDFIDNNANEVTPTEKQEQPMVVRIPVTNCEIRIWYNYQIVAIGRINQRWIELGMSLGNRAKRAYELRHNARVNGRFMMQDRFDVAALRDRDNKKYGNPDGPTFEHLLAYTKEKGLAGDAIYEAIIESSSTTSPIYLSECGQ